MDNLNILLFVVAADIVSLSQPALFLDHINPFCMIVYIEPVADVLAIAIDREFLALKRIVDNQGDELLWELVRAVVIGAVRDVGREMVRVNVSLYQEVRTCLAGGIGAMGGIGGRLIEIAALLFQGTVHLVRRDMEEFLAFLEAAVLLFPGSFCTVQHDGRPSGQTPLDP